MRLKAVAAADLHLTDKSLEEYRWGVFAEMKEAFKRNNATTFLLLGDITDFKDKHSSSLVNRMVAELEDLAALGPVYILKGNHDYIDADLPFFKFLESIENITWINEPMEEQFWEDNVLFLPHTRTPVVDWEDIDFEPYDYIFLHQTFAGSKSSEQYTIEHGPSHKLFKKCKGKVIGGDIHVPQIVGKKVEYIGSPARLRFGDTFQPRIALIENGSLTGIPTNLVIRHKLEITHPDEISKVQLEEGDQVKVVVTLEEKDYERWQDIKQKVKAKLEEKKVHIHAIELKKSKTVKIKALDKKEDTSGTSFKDVIGRFSTKEKLSEEIIKKGEDIVASIKER